jgi:hypothetical protein
MRLLSALLYLYPASFRADYGREMNAIVGARLAETTSVSSRIGLWLDTIADVVRNATGVHFDILRQDLRYSLRTLARSPGFALTAILVTALGIGANTAAFSVADFVLIRPLPYKDADRLFKVWEAPLDGTNGRNEVSPALYADWTRTTRSFESLGAHYNSATNLVGGGEPVRVETAFVTGSLLPILGVSPARGRLLNDADNSDQSSVVISYSLWQSRFGGEESIIGRRLLIDGSPRVVVGVMPPDFHYPSRLTGLWAPMALDQMKDDDIGNTYWYVLAKLKPGVARAQAAAEMKAVGNRLRAANPGLDDVTFAVDGLRDEFSRQSRVLLLALCGAAMCVLLIACANLANLLLARALMRRRELVVRSALGAGRERLVRQSITESLVLAVLGGVLGVVIAYAAVPLLTRLVPMSLPIAQTPSVDPRILIFAALLTVVTGVGFGVLPAWRSARQLDLGARDGQSGGRRESARGRGWSQEGGRFRVLNGCGRSAAACHSPPGKGEQARRGVWRVRCRRLAAGVQGLHSPDEGADVRRHALRQRVSKACGQPRRLSRIGREAHRARARADGMGRECEVVKSSDSHNRRRRGCRHSRTFSRDVPAPRRRCHG